MQNTLWGGLSPDFSVVGQGRSLACFGRDYWCKAVQGDALMMLVRPM